VSLRELIERTVRESGLRRADLTFSGNDPFTNDTPGNRAWAEWIVGQIEAAPLTNRTIHPRGFHYVLVTRAPAKPDGQTYRNTEVDYKWMQRGLALARWLGYLTFDQIADNRNSPPTVREHYRVSSVSGAYILSGVDRDALPAEDWADDLHPRVEPLGVWVEQPYRLVLVGEKSSLEPVLQPLSERYTADLYLPSGDISDTLVWQMARTASEDGRPMIAFYFSDCDPAGWNMPHVLSRKLQALQAVHLPNLDWRVIHAGLTPEQVKGHDLPTSPLQGKRSGVVERWRRRWGIEQTEIDAMATLRPELLRRIAVDAVGPYFDSTLTARSWAVRLRERLSHRRDHHDRCHEAL